MVSKRDLQDYLARYQDLQDQWVNRVKGEKEDIANDRVKVIDMQPIFLNARCKEIIRMLMNDNSFLPQQQIADELQISKRSLYYDICRINEWLDCHRVPAVEVVRGKGLQISPATRQFILDYSDHFQKEDNYILSPTERVSLILCILVALHPVENIDILVRYCMVSRNTIFNDLRILTKQLQKYDLTLDYESKIGYVISGDPIKIRALFLMDFHELHALHQKSFFDFMDRSQVAEYTQRLKQVENALNTKYVEGNLESLAALLPRMARGDTQLDFPNLKEHEFRQTREFQLILTYFPEFPPQEQVYLCLHLLGARVAVASNDIFDKDNNQQVYEITKFLIADFEKIACVEFENKEELGRALFIHINSSLYRYQFGIQIIDSISDDIIREYPDIFHITKIVSKHIEQQIGLPIQDAEVAYLSLHFGAHLPISPRNHTQFRILAVCANGISTGHMLKRELQKLLPEAKIVAVIAESDVMDAKSICNLVISTVPITCNVPVLQVHPILTKSDKEEILRHVKASHLTADTDNLFSIVKPYLNKKDYPAVRQGIHNYLMQSTSRPATELLPTSHRLLDYLTLDRICIYDQEYRWSDAIREAGSCLLKAGSIQRSYIDSIISQLQYYGPYMFIMPRVLLAHSKPDTGVNRLDVSLHIFQKSVPFSDFHHANIIIMLSATDQERHLKILRDLLEVFSIQAKVDDILQKRTPSEVLDYLYKILRYGE